VAIGFAGIGLATSRCPSQAQEATSEIPVWRRGISTFDGTGYDSSPHGTSPASPVPAADLTPSYTVPVRPGVPAPADPTLDPNWLREQVPDSGVIKAAAVQEELVAPQGIPEPMVDQLEAPIVDPLPLEQEVLHWYQYPARWMRGWDSHAEFGLDGSSGNADTLAIQTGLEMKRKNDWYSLSLDLDYRQASSRNVTTEDNGRFNLDYDRMLSDSPWSLFGKAGLEWDRFKAFDLRLNLNSGVGYYWIRSDAASFVTRFGAGASKEFGAPDDSWSPEAVFGLDAERQLTSRQKVRAKLDYFPAWEDFSDFRLVADASWEILLDDSDNLSLKLAVTDRYDSTPQGAEPNDIYYSLLLLYKF